MGIFDPRDISLRKVQGGVAVLADVRTFIVKGAITSILGIHETARSFEGILSNRRLDQLDDVLVAPVLVLAPVFVRQEPLA